MLLESNYQYGKVSSNKSLKYLSSRTIGSVTSILRGRLKFLSISSRKSTSISSCLACIPQFLVRRRSSAAFSMRITGGYVSFMKKKSSTNAVTFYSIISIRNQSQQMHPFVAYQNTGQILRPSPPQVTCGNESANKWGHERSGEDANCENSNLEICQRDCLFGNALHTAMPRASFEKISENTAATTDKGADPKNPAKNLDIIIVCTSLDTATAKLNIARKKVETTIGSLRPFSSESGAQNIGPKANPESHQLRPWRLNSAIPRT
jgi:hypothetical protein